MLTKSPAPLSADYLICGTMSGIPIGGVPEQGFWVFNDIWGMLIDLGMTRVNLTATADPLENALIGHFGVEYAAVAFLEFGSSRVCGIGGGFPVCSLRVFGRSLKVCLVE